jgi:hypothetical protein
VASRGDNHRGPDRITTVRWERDYPPPTPQPTPCRIWQGTLLANRGYGLMYRPEVRRNVRVHKWVWEQVNGPLPEGLNALHKCDNPPCFRLDHLFAGTHRENASDKIAKGRQVHKLTAEQVRAIRVRLAEGGTHRGIAAEFGVTKSSVTGIARGTSWRWLS